MDAADELRRLAFRAGEDGVDPRTSLGEASAKPEEEREPSDQSHRERRRVLEREAHRGPDVVVVGRDSCAPPLLIGPVPQVWIRTLREARRRTRRGAAATRRPRQKPRAASPRTRGSSRASSSACARDVAAADEALVDQRLQRVDLCVAYRLGGLERAAADEHRQPHEQPLLFRREEVVRPADRRVERLLAGIRVAAAFQVQPAAQPLEQLLGREDRNARGRKLERERKVVEPVAELDRRSRLAELRAERAGARREKRRPVTVVERRHAPGVLALQLQPLPARHEQLRPARLPEPRDVGRNLRQQVLGVVEQQQRALRGERVGERLLERDSRTFAHVERLRDRVERERRIAKRRERDPPDAVGQVLGQLGRGLERQTRLPGAAGPGERQQPDALVAQQADDLLQLARAAEERRRRHGQVRLPQALQRREALLAELEHALRRRQVLQPVLAEVADVLVPDEVTRRLRQQHLAAVSGRRRSVPRDARPSRRIPRSSRPAHRCGAPSER